MASLFQFSDSHVGFSLEYLQGWRFHNLSGHLGNPVLNKGYSNGLNFLSPDTESGFSLLHLAPVAFCPITVYPGESGSVFSTTSH